MPCDDGRQRTTTDDVIRYRIEVDVRRRAVCERAFSARNVRRHNALRGALAQCHSAADSEIIRRRYNKAGVRGSVRFFTCAGFRQQEVKRGIVSLPIDPKATQILFSLARRQISLAFLA